MNVKELIEELQKYPADALVCLNPRSCETCPDVESVSLFKSIVFIEA